MSGNFTLSQDAPSGAIKLGGHWEGFVVLNAAVKSKAQTETVQPHLEGLFGVKNRVTDLGVVKLRRSGAGSSAHLVAQCVGGVAGFTFCRGRNHGPGPRQLFFSLTPPSNTSLTPTTSSLHKAVKERREGGREGDLPARIWLTGDWEGALRAHVTINNPC